MINLEKEIREQPKVLSGVQAANAKTLAAIADAVKKNEITAISFAARGTSDHACIYAQYLFHRFTGIPCSLATPSAITAYGAKMHFERHLVIGVSQSGRAEDVRAVIANAKECGAVTVAVTNNEDSPLAKDAEYHLFCGAGPEVSIAATKTFTSQMYLLALLCAEISENEKLKETLAKVPEAAADFMDSVPAQVEKIIGRYRFLQDAFVLGRGMAYPIALEGALKVLETNKIRVRGYASSDFQHGPMAQLSKDTLCIVLAPKGPMAEDANTIIEKVTATGAEILVITDDKEVAEKSALSILIPSVGCDCCAPYFLAMTMQFFALRLTEVKGIDPDQSEVLHKITITK